MNKPPSNIKECVAELIIVIEELAEMPPEDTGHMFSVIKNELLAFLKLKEWIEEQ